MVGIVIVSHSALLAAGVQELARQMVQNAVPLASAAGIDDAENPLGTDVMAIQEAIASVYSQDGVLVLMDLGSAVLSAEMAWELLTTEQQANVKLCAAPLVEGTIAAAVQAATGASLEAVIAAAQNALTAKASQLSVEHPSSVSPKPSPIESAEITQEIHLMVQNPLGLHARPAAQFVTTSSRFQSQIGLQNITKGTEKVNGKSINQVVTLGVRQGDEIAISAAGSDAAAALSALQQLVENKFGESDSIQNVGAVGAVGAQGLRPHPDQFTESDSKSRYSDSQPSIPHNLSGIPVSPGIAIAPILFYPVDSLQDGKKNESILSQFSLPVAAQFTDNPEAEWQQLQTALSTAKSEIQQIRQKTAKVTGEAEAAIFDAHLLCLSDPLLLDAIHQHVFDEQKSAVAAWQAVINETIISYQEIEDSYLQARAADIADVGQRVLRLLIGEELPLLQLSNPTILVANDLSPSQLMQLDLTNIMGICTATGGATSHLGILARSRGIPTVMGVGYDLLRLENGTVIGLNGETGQIWIEPDTAQIQQLETLRDKQLATAAALKAKAQQPASTRDGHRINVMANIANVTDAQLAQSNGADGVGLLRSEFLYLKKEEAPTAAQQEEIYRAIAQIISPHPLIIRTLDIGGDKSLPYLDKTQEDNPFLGWRGIRVLLDCPDLFKTQLSAILRASHEHPIKLLLPMVTSVGEIRATKQLIAQVKADLREREIPFNETIEIGIMVEVPAAVALADKLAAEVNFFSIGTNDLSQYVMAADRTNTQVTALADAFEPAVLRMIQQTVKAAHKVGISVAVCGELAGDVLAIPILVGLGVDELSLNPAAIPRIKAGLALWTMADVDAIAPEVLQFDSAEAVKSYVAGRLKIMG
ncbi:MAG: phosphoenolpyruvate--protein phosphotransferase [Coleofasciculus sp. C1-SOL-03]|uniref:phosphoenolpyruvate--protein phosphotransferase n=1 Tax=Coleofasciculus sp. C1-SOL-03 TaxID=3069522 RepID=UPI0032FAC9C5